MNESSQEAAIFYYSTTYNGTDISPYNGGYLRKIVYAHQTGSTLVDNWADFMQNGSNSYITVDATATYSYESTGRLIKARDELSGYEVNYGYTNGKVTSITEKAGTSSLTTGQQILLSYYDNYTEVRTSGTDDVINTSDDILTRYVFDNSGRTITAYSMDVNGTTIYGASSGQFNDDSESKNSIRVSSYVSDSAANYLMNGGFENSTAMNYWYTSGTASRSAAAKYTGKYGATISATSGVTSSICQYVKLTQGAYTLSLNINTNDCAGATVKLIAKSANNTYTEVIPVDEYAASGAYAFASLNFDVKATSENYQIIIQITGSKSMAQTIMVDNVMLAKSVGVVAPILRDIDSVSPLLVCGAESAVVHVFLYRVGKYPCEAVGAVFLCKRRDDTVLEMHAVKILGKRFFNGILTADILLEGVPPQHDIILSAGGIKRIIVERKRHHSTSASRSSFLVRKLNTARCSAGLRLSRTSKSEVSCVLLFLPQSQMDSLRKSRAPSFCFSIETSVPVFQPSRMRISNGMVTLPLVVTNLYVFIFGFLLSVFLIRVTS